MLTVLVSEVGLHLTIPGVMEGGNTPPPFATPADSVEDLVGEMNQIAQEPDSEEEAPVARGPLPGLPGPGQPLADHQPRDQALQVCINDLRDVVGQLARRLLPTPDQGAGHGRI